MTTLSLSFSSCQKEKTTTNSLASIVQDISFDTNNDGVPDNLDSSTKVNVAAAAQSPNCCRCELVLEANRPNFSISPNRTWIVQVRDFNGCNGESILQVGGQVTALNPNVYSNVGNPESYEFFVDNSFPANSSLELIGFVGAFYNSPGSPSQNQLPINVQAQVVCENAILNTSNGSSLILEFGCDMIPDFNEEGCAGQGTSAAVQSGLITNCTAMIPGRN